MAKRPDPTKRPANPINPINPVSPVNPVGSTPVRNTVLPKPQPAPKPQITKEMIAKRAYEIFKRGHGGSQMEHWIQAERELRGGK